MIRRFFCITGMKMTFNESYQINQLVFLLIEI